MMNKINFIWGIVFLVGVLLISTALISAEVSYCCEKIKNGGPWCVNDDLSQCDPSKRSVPTSCEATSYCRLGTCVDTQNGICMENTPQVTCDPSLGGFWEHGEPDEIPQCQLGCCLIGEQAAFVTQTRCKSLSSFYGLETNYRADIQSEIQCIASARPKVKGACVFEKEYQRTCKFLTKKECQEMESENLDVEFHEGFLCSATNLSTNCGKSKKTTCVEGKDEVYFLDTCGNLANVYRADKIDDDYYWAYITGTRAGVEVCSPASTDCGNCDYFLGTTCKAYKRGEVEKPVYGNYICKDLGCQNDEFRDSYGRQPNHGETWCAKAEGISTITVTGGRISSSGEDLPGGRYFRMVCYNGEVNVEPCADYRQEVCIQSEVSTFKTAACRVNKWQDCYAQDNIKDCENSDKRDCKVVEEFSVLTDETGESLFYDEDGEQKDASCVPKYAPGFNFWNEGGDAESTCSMVSSVCVVDYGAKIGDLVKEEKGDVIPNEICLEECVKEDCGITGEIWASIRRNLLGGQFGDGAECEESCYETCMPDCVYEDNGWKVYEDKWAEEMNEMCVSLGDCGSSDNYIGEEGYYDIIDFIVRSEDEEED